MRFRPLLPCFSIPMPPDAKVTILISLENWFGMSRTPSYTGTVVACISTVHLYLPLYASS